MKKSKIIVNILLGCIFVFCIVATILPIEVCNNCLENYKLLSEMPAEMSSPHAKEALSLFLKLLFAIIFSALSAIASATIAVLYNLPWLKAKKHAQSEELKND